MRFKPRARRKALGLTSLIDVIFLLLLFFMLTSSFTRYQFVPVGSGASGSGAAQRPALLRVHSDAAFDLNGISVETAALTDSLSRLKSDQSGAVAIWSGPEATVQNLVDAVTAVRAAGLQPIVLTDHQ